MTNLQQIDQNLISADTQFRLEQRLRRYAFQYAPHQSIDGQRWLLQQIYQPLCGKRHRERILQHYPSAKRPAGHEALRGMAVEILRSLSSGDVT